MRVDNKLKALVVEVRLSAASILALLSIGVYRWIDGNKFESGISFGVAGVLLVLATIDVYVKVFSQDSDYDDLPQLVTPDDLMSEYC